MHDAVALPGAAKVGARLPADPSAGVRSIGGVNALKLLHHRLYQEDRPLTFFDLLRDITAANRAGGRAAAQRTSQLARFAHGDDMPYLLQRICRMQYIHAPDLAPTKALLDDYRNGDLATGKPTNAIFLDPAGRAAHL